MCVRGTVLRAAFRCVLLLSSGCRGLAMYGREAMCRISFWVVFLAKIRIGNRLAVFGRRMIPGLYPVTTMSTLRLTGFSKRRLFQFEAARVLLKMRFKDGSLPDVLPRRRWTVNGNRLLSV